MKKFSIYQKIMFILVALETFISIVLAFHQNFIGGMLGLIIAFEILNSLKFDEIDKRINEIQDISDRADYRFMDTYVKLHNLEKKLDDKK